MVTVRAWFPPSRLAWFTALTLAFCALLSPVCSAPALAKAGDSGESAGSTARLRAALESASRSYLDAKAALDQSQRRQAELAGDLTSVETQLATLTVTASDIAVAAYLTGGLTTMSTLIDAGSPDMFFDRAAALVGVAMRNGRELRALTAVQRRLTISRAAVASEVANGQLQFQTMATAKQAAEVALASAGGGQPTSGPDGTASSTASPAPRKANGAWPAESCSLDDPTTSGCVTPRLLHALQQARAVGYTRTVSCYRSGGSGEHPKGRACDFASAQRGYGGIATGDDRAYGNDLATFLVANADALAVGYVIWFRQVWLPSSGWRSYSGCDGDPSSDHTNHVHLSVH